MVATHRAKTPELVTGNPSGDLLECLCRVVVGGEWNRCSGVNGEECCFGFRPKPSEVMGMSGYTDDRPDQSEDKSGYRFVPSLS